MGLRLSMLANHKASEALFRQACREQGHYSAEYEASLQGPFPTYSVTEDYALSLELKKAGVKGTYICE